MDENSNGSVDMKELLDSLDGAGLSEEDAEQIMVDIDENEDGQITLVEFNAYMACNYCGDASACPISKEVRRPCACTRPFHAHAPDPSMRMHATPPCACITCPSPRR